MARKRVKDLEKIKTAVTLLLTGNPLPSKYRDHGLIGNYVSRRECHLELD